jgi:hypothetical protein
MAPKMLERRREIRKAYDIILYLTRRHIKNALYMGIFYLKLFFAVF